MKTYLTIFFLLIAGCAYSAEVDLEIIKQIESGGNPHAYNERSGATGLYQLTPICVKDFAQDLCRGLVKEIRSDCVDDFPKLNNIFNPTLNEHIASWYMNTRIPHLLKNYGIEDTLDHRLAAYNWGAKKLRDHLRGEIKMPKETKNYIRDYRKLQ